MGEAQTALVDDASALFWNAAGLTRIGRHSVVFSHATIFSGAAYRFMGYGHTLPNGYGSLGLGVQNLVFPSIAETDASGFETGEKHSPNDLAVTLAYAYPVTWNWFDGGSLALSQKFIHSQITSAATAMAFDFSMQTPTYEVLARRLRLGLAVQNVGSELQYRQIPEPLPLTIRSGAAYALSPRWTLAADAIMVRDNAPAGALGAEFAIGDWQSLKLKGRAGLNSRTWSEVNGVSGLNMGLGIFFKTASFDYALQPMGALGLTHLIGLHIHFGEPTKGSLDALPVALPQ